MRNAHCLSYAALLLVFSILSARAAGQSSARAGVLEATDDGQRIKLTVAGELFAELHYKGFAKPIIYPILGPGNALMVRRYPMEKGVEGESDDHPHHQSLWYTHGDVNGVSFWHLGEDAGTILCSQAQITDSETKSDPHGTTSEVHVALTDDWRDSKGKVVCTDQQDIGFVVLPNGDRAIDYKITIKATEGDVTFGDTKEGSAGIRTHPKLRTDNGAQVVNSEGAKGKDIWGKKAKWVDYSASIDGELVGVAVFDHPSNPRHPTWWHARDYGLVAANPFGVHDFERKPRGTGDMKIEDGQSVTFQYRFLFHAGDSQSSNVAEQYARWARSETF